MNTKNDKIFKGYIMEFCHEYLLGFRLTLRIKWKRLCVNHKTLTTLRCNIPLIECCLKKTFISLRCLSEQSGGQYILMKVFSHCPYKEMW